MSIFEYGFMQRAFLVGILLAVITPLIGMTVVLKRMSMVGDALAHASLAGVAIGMLFGINPVAGAGGICVVAALAIEAIRRRLPRYSENAIAIVMSAGIGLAGVLSGFVKNSANFNSFLFGSIVSISTAELLGVCAVSAAVLLLLILFRKELFYIGFDENAARISGVPVRKVNFLFTVLTACTVSIASRTVGTLIISSMLVVPVAFGMQMGNSYRMTVLWSVLAAVGTTILGLFISYYWGTKPGGTIVLLEVACFVAALGIKGDGTMTTPVYIVEGFLGSGKTKLIENSLRLRHCRNVLIFQFEEGEEVLDTKEAERCSWKIRSWDRDELETHLEEVADRVEVELEIHRYEEIWVEWNVLEHWRSFSCPMRSDEGFISKG